MVWNIFYFPIYWECHHPQLTFIFFRGVGQPPTRTYDTSPSSRLRDRQRFLVSSPCHIMLSQAPGFKDAGPVLTVLTCRSFGDFLQQTENSRRILSIHAMTLEEMVVLGRLPEPKKFGSSDWDSLDASHP